MKIFRVTVTRTCTQEHRVEIEAETADEARELAGDEILDVADNDWGDLTEIDLEITAVTELSDADASEEAENEAAI